MKRVGIFFGGPSNEHEVSILSAKNVTKYIDTTKYQPILLYWDMGGSFYKINTIDDLKPLSKNQSTSLQEIHDEIDVAFLVTHGKYGEDGVLQGMLEGYHIPYTGSRVLSSALCMDKAMFKKWVSMNDFAQTPYWTLDFTLLSSEDFSVYRENIKNTAIFPIFIKPANSGSSVGITRIEDFDTFDDAIKVAQKYDTKVVVEEGLFAPREIEVAVLGNQNPIVSEPGELILAKSFYDYEDKYKKNETLLKIPANLPKQVSEEIKKITKKVYLLCDCRGFARVDFFYSNGKIYLNEINTLPGFTDQSMFPKLISHYGLSYKEMIDKIIGLAY